MSKRVLILENSETMQSLLKDKTKKTEMELSFETDGLKMLLVMHNSTPDVVLINACSVNPKSMELVRLIKSVEKFAKIPVGVFTIGDFSFKEQYVTNSGADLFFTYSDETVVENLEKLFSMVEKTELSKPARYDITKQGISEKIFSSIANLSSIEEIAHNYLNMLAEFCEIPACSIFINTKDSVEAFYVCAQNFTDDEISEFFEVCVSDFEDNFVNLNVNKISPKRLDCSFQLEKYHTGDIPLSSYENFSLAREDLQKLGTVHVVKEGSFSSYQLDLLSFSTKQIVPIIESAIMLKEKQKFEKNVRKAFGRFVPEQIIDELVENAEQNDNISVGEKRDVAILFSDIRSFTSISELNKPETIVSFLNRYFTAMCTVIKKYGGTVDKFIGDAIMALFGAPVSYEDNSRRAVAAAYEMREALKSVDLGDLVMPESMKFNIGIGIHYGDVTVGSIGSSDKTDYTVIGDSVNLASRLEGLTKTYGSMILISQSVKDDIKTNEFVYRHLDDVKVKGKNKPVPIYAIDECLEEFSNEYRDAYAKGLELYQQGIWNLAYEYFELALQEEPNDKASKLMLERCEEFRRNPPENWDGAITFHTK